MQSPLPLVPLRLSPGPGMGLIADLSLSRFSLLPPPLTLSPAPMRLLVVATSVFLGKSLHLYGHSIIDS
jgi:hypothetical protein